MDCRTPQFSHAVRAPKFGVGPGDVVAGLIGRIDSSRFLELVSTDLMGMTIPQTSIEAVQRGPDAARETGIRNMCGMIGNMFFLGWVSRIFMKALGSRLNAYNPQGIQGAASINAGNLEAFGNLYAQVLKEPGVRNAAQARERLVQRFLQNIHSSDSKLAKELFNKAGAAADAQAKAVFDQLAAEGAQGTLSKDAVAALQKFFALEGTRGVPKGGVVGTSDFSAQAWDILKRQGAGADAEKEFLKTRLRLSAADLKGREKEWIALADKEALKGGLSGTVNWGLDEAGKPILMERGRDTLLKDFKHFLEQFVDRANEAGTSRRWGQNVEAIQKALFASAEKPGLLGKFMPKAGDGLMSAALKAKWGLVRIPLVMTLVCTISVAFLNNWLTRRKHGGKAFFPGEGGPDEGGMPVAKPANAASQPAFSTAPSANSFAAPGANLRRPGGFSQFNRGGAQ